jgi:hypothetical protein
VSQVRAGTGRAPAGRRYPLGLMCPRPRLRRGFPALLATRGGCGGSAAGRLRARLHRSSSLGPRLRRGLPPLRCAARRFQNRPSGHRLPASHGRRQRVLNSTAAAAPGLKRPGAGRRWGDVGSVEKRRVPGRARQRASKTDSRSLSERSERSERSEFCAAQVPEHRRAPSAQPRARTPEPQRLPAPGRSAATAHRTAQRP